MKLKVIASSSKGNCYILETPTWKLLLDAGVPFREIQKALDFDLRGISGCLVTHEHADHSKAVSDLLKAGIDVWMSYGTMNALELEPRHNLKIVGALQRIYFGSALSGNHIMPFKTEHDTEEPLGFVIRVDDKSLLYLTDSYYCRHKFVGLDYILVECNYCKDILDKNVEAGLPEPMKKRLLSSHFELQHVKQFLEATDKQRLKDVVLIHLSDGNSDAARMKWEVEEVTEARVTVAVPGLELELGGI